MKRTILLLLVLAASVKAAEAASFQPLPKLISSELPQYPLDARAARIQGAVKLWFQIDSRGKVVRAETTSGHPLLRQAAIRDIKTWRFHVQDARPGRFETEFVYRLLEESSESPRVSVSMRDFRRVEIASELQEFPYTERYEPNLDLSEPLKVYVTRCEVDGADIPCEQVSILLTEGKRVFTPKTFHFADKHGFFVPRRLRKNENFGVRVSTTVGSFQLESVHRSFLKGRWRIIILHSPFPEEWRYLEGKQSCLGLIHFQWSEPERQVYTACSP